MDKLEEKLRQGAELYVKEHFASDDDENLTLPHQFSPAFERKCKKLFRPRFTFHFPRVPRQFKRIAVMMVVVLSLTSVVTYAELFHRLNTPEMFIEDLGTHSLVRFDLHRGEIIPPTIQQIFYPTYITEGYRVTETYHDTLGNWTEFRNATNDDAIIFTQDIKTPTKSWINTEETPAVFVKGSGRTYIYYVFKGFHSYKWPQGGYIFDITGTNKEEVFKMAQSVKLVE